MKPLHVRVLVVAGRFDDTGGRASGYIRKLVEKAFVFCDHSFPGFFHIAELNGGSFEELLIVKERLDQYGVVIWMPDVPNDKPKLIDDIKKKYPHCLLVTSKNNSEGKYPLLTLIARALNQHANLFVEFVQENNKWLASVMDPLGNAYCLRESDIYTVAAALFGRIYDLCNVTRLASERIGDAIEVPDQPEFFAIARELADQFHDLLHAVNQGRFVGNLSFRCESGFPAFRDSSYIFVSRRNIDKRDIDRSGFVAVDATHLDSIRYFGDYKPSVDTAIQLKLFAKYPKVNYMLHAHIYVDEAPRTFNVLPCGAVEEALAVEDTLNGIPADDEGWEIKVVNQTVNLRGHGCLILAGSPEYIRTLKFVARGFPELQD
jgi:hypothetical protein